MASRLETSQEFEAAFEELYRQSPAPQMFMPSSMTRQNPMPFPTQPVQNGSGIKAIFDMMKLKNSSMSSCLNTSVATASTSGGDADVDSHHDNDAKVQKGKENLTPEKKEGQRTQAEVTSVSTAAHLSPARNNFDENQADKETLQLVSKLVQRLHSSADAGENNSDSDDGDWADAEPLNSRNSALCPAINQAEPVTMVTGGGMDISQQSAESQSSNDRQSLHHTGSICRVPATDVAMKHSDGNHLCKKLNGTTLDKLDRESNKMPARDIEESKTTTCVRNLRTRSRVSCALNRNNKGQSIDTKHVKKASTAAKLTATQQNDNSKNVATTVLRGKKCGTVRVEDSPGDKVLAQAAAGKLYPVKNTQPRNLLGAQDAADEVDADVIPTKAMGRMYAEKDLFSLDSSCSDSDLEVGEDVILFASKKSRIPKLGRKEGKDKKLSSKAAGHTTSSEKDSKKDRVTGKGKEAIEDKNKEFRLTSWSLKPVPRMKGVQVEGKLPKSTYFWMSSVIVERISTRRLKSINGSVYILYGNLSVRNTLAAGFSKELARLFRYGFPENWKDLFESSLHSNEWSATLPLHPAVNQDGLLKKQMNSTVTPKETALSTPKSREKRRSLKRKNITRLFQNERKGSELVVPPAKTPRITPRKPTKSKAALGEVSVTSKSAVNNHSLLRKKDLEESPTIWTPRGVTSRALEATEVRRTLSGRAVIPPLARWAGQFVQRDNDGSVTIGFASLAAEKHFAQLAEKELHVPRKLRNSLANSYLQMKLPSSHQNSPLARQQTSKPNCHKAPSNESDEMSSQSEKSTVRAQQSTHESLKKTFETDSLTMDVSVDNMVDEVMELVHQSKARRTKTVKKQITCYSVTSQQKGTVLSSSFEYSQQEESVTDSKSLQAEDVSVGRKSEKKLLNSERLLAEQNTGAVRRNRQRKARSSVQVVSSDTDDDFDLKTVSSSHKLKTRTQAIQRKKIQRQSGGIISGNEQNKTSNAGQRTNISDCREDTDVQEQKKENGSSRQPISQQTTRGRRKGVQSDSTDRGKTKQSTKSLSYTKEKTRSDQTVSSSSEDSLQDAPKTTDDHNSSSRGKGEDKKLTGAPKTRQKNSATSAAQEDKCPWSQEERDKLHEAAESINSNSCQFWEEVSQHVGTRSVKECIAFYLKDKPENSKKGRPKDAKKAKQGDKAPQSLQLQSKKGTLKRRREVRAILEQDCNDSYQDALFLGTPFKTKKKAKVLQANFSKTEEEVFGQNPNFFTPKRDGPYLAGTAISHTPVSTRKTPAVAPAHSLCLSKDSGTSKKDVDQYMFRLKKNKQQLKKTFQKEQTIRKLAPESTPSTHHIRKSSVASNGLFRISEGESCNDDEEDDYYYSDDADN